ncbi:hypothetical protein AB0L40_26335, partial [Patulibacter sp. NPDC049589]|uniref:hypothetical protein n=1 Tax=Patulibacter sp. NPDC049589 TaxID=3154731 RepID=UPI00342E9F2B
GAAATGATAAPGAPSFTVLAAAVCRAEVGAVPPVPDPEKSGAPEHRRYVRAVQTAAGGLASAFVALEGRRPESQGTLEPLVARARAVERTARAAARGGTGGSADVRIAIARLNEASSAASLPACAL